MVLLAGDTNLVYIIALYFYSTCYQQDNSTYHDCWITIQTTLKIAASNFYCKITWTLLWVYIYCVVCYRMIAPSNVKVLVMSLHTFTLLMTIWNVQSTMRCLYGITFFPYDKWILFSIWLLHSLQFLLLYFVL